VIVLLFASLPTVNTELKFWEPPPVLAISNVSPLFVRVIFVPAVNLFNVNVGKVLLPIKENPVNVASIKLHVVHVGVVPSVSSTSFKEPGVFIANVTTSRIYNSSICW
jgi:hypothetical protein